MLDPEELYSAWLLWVKSPLGSNFMLWDQPLYFWDRLGFAFQFVGIIMAIAEIVGPSRLRIFSQYTKQYIGLIGFLHYLSNQPQNVYLKYLKKFFAPVYYSAIILAIFFVIRLGERNIIGKYSAGFLAFNAFIVVYLSAASLLTSISHSRLKISNLILLAIAFLGSVVILNSFVPTRENSFLSIANLLVIGLLFTLFVLWVAYFLLSILMDTIIRILDRPNLNNIFKVTSVVFVVIGMHFNLLAS